MLDLQLDLFSNGGAWFERVIPQDPPSRLVPTEMDDEALTAAIPESRLGEASLLAAEAGRRRLTAAVPALAVLCRRFAGFGLDRVVPEQADALEALAAIGGREAAHAVAEMIERAVVTGPALKLAVSAAARLRAILSADTLQLLLRHPEPSIRADACRCARPLPNLIGMLIDLLNDGEKIVARSAACALGAMGRIEARPMIKHLLRHAPSQDVIEAAVSIADEECVVLLGRIARAVPGLADRALDSLDAIDHPRAEMVAASIRTARQQENSGTLDAA